MQKWAVGVTWNVLTPSDHWAGRRVDRASAASGDMPPRSMSTLPLRSGSLQYLFHDHLCQLVPGNVARHIIAVFCQYILTPAVPQDHAVLGQDFLVEQEPAAAVSKAGRVVLHKFHVLQRRPSHGRQGMTIAGDTRSVVGVLKKATESICGQDNGPRLKWL